METSCGVVLVNLGAVLLLQYPQGHWDFPKGHIEASDANHKATVRRELKEETGIADVSFVEGSRNERPTLHAQRTAHRKGSSLVPCRNGNPQCRAFARAQRPSLVGLGCGGIPTDPRCGAPDPSCSPSTHATLGPGLITRQRRRRRVDAAIEASR